MDSIEEKLGTEDGHVLNAGVYTNFPFKPKKYDGHDHSNLKTCNLYKLLPPEMKAEVEKNLHLLEYLHILPIDTMGIPRYVPKLESKHGDIEDPNVIYRVNDQIYVHIYPNKNDVRNFYIPIEPILLTGVGFLIKELEIKLVDHLTGIQFDPENLEEKERILRESLDAICIIGKKNPAVSSTAGAESGIKKLGSRFFPSKEDPDKNHIYVTKEQYEALKYSVIRDKIGVGFLDPYINDNKIEDITCNGLGPIFIEHKVFKGLRSVIEFNDNDALNHYIVRLAERIGKPITFKNPIVDSTLPDGSRINIVFGDDISKNGSNFTIRKFADIPFSILQVIKGGTLDYRMAAYLWILIGEGMSGFICGETASGKTTTLNGITAFVNPESKLVSIEDTPELQIPHKNWTRETTRGSTRGAGTGEGSGSDVTMFDLLKAALRQRPNYILVGEIRGVEGNVAFQAMQTGHPVMSTFHAATVEKLIQRLTADPINIPKTYVDNLNFVIIQSAVRRPDGKLVRRVLSINEVLGYNPDKGGISFIEAFSWDPVTDTHVFSAMGSSYILENKIATRLGIPGKKKKAIYDEIEKRAKILERLSDEGIVNYWEFFNTIAKITKSGMLRIQF
ncbi:type II/IV secretion system ATPase subunit [Methanosarcina mazei]|jgi:flagellar protein FlaI|uniref:Secretion system protein E n=2 Tax=Methanosarcina mazei TaxID=2209 RepID=A0A0F8PZJ0_METMZ|nr:type II/IV secretion system ATPase subunit [Methanosarcina mazei]AKB67526.1 Flagella-related protein FlaI [Methanosarcina mazei LYC]KKF98780.1 secretion system protein E [Methanosarcina mazei]KKG37224.1 secretion system protein E [Methanosarcina mazei]KKH35736.1 secretion system protein E [Methanosarcina mazei]KKH53519.1 secretion system protein E [Methanosarcina mazei]